MKHDRSHVRMTGESETVSEYPASLLAAVLVLGGAIKVGVLRFAGPVPDEGDYPTEHEGTCGIDGTWIDPKLLTDGWEEDMEYVRQHGVFEVVDEKECDWWQSPHGEVGGQNDMVKCAVRGWSIGKSRSARTKNEQVGPADVVSTLPPSEGLKMLVSTMMTGHDDQDHADGPIEMATWDVSRAHLYGGVRAKGQVGQTLQEHVWQARCSVNLERHVVRSVGW